MMHKAARRSFPEYLANAEKKAGHVAHYLVADTEVLAVFSSDFLP